LDKTADGTLGLCKICHEYIETGLLEMDYTANVCLTHLSEEEMRRLEAELELSQVVQRALLPQQVPAIPGMDLAVFSRPAQIIGGDYFDFLRFRDGAHGLAVADVAGVCDATGRIFGLGTACRPVSSWRASKRRCTPWFPRLSLRRKCYRV